MLLSVGSSHVWRCCWVLWYGRRTTSRLHLTQVSATLTLLSSCSCHQASYRPASSSSLSSTSSSSSSWLRRLRVLSKTGAAAGLGRLWIVWGAARKKWPKVEHVQRRRPRPSTTCRHLDLSSIIQGEDSRVFQYFSLGVDALLAFPLFSTISSLTLASLHFNLDTELVTCSHSGLTLEVHYIYGSWFKRTECMELTLTFSF